MVLVTWDKRDVEYGVRTGSPKGLGWNMGHVQIGVAAGGHPTRDAKQGGRSNGQRIAKVLGRKIFDICMAHSLFWGCCSSVHLDLTTICILVP